MCTLTFGLTKKGYELFFNRDEQYSRPKAIPPEFNVLLQSIYPIDVSEQTISSRDGTWLAVDQYGMSLALLNNYPKESIQSFVFDHHKFLSRGDIILSLLNLQVSENIKLTSDSIKEHLNQLNLTNYKPFKLIVFSNQLTQTSGGIQSLNWDGENISILNISANDLPITSSSINLREARQARKETFDAMCNDSLSSSSQLKAYHFSTETDTSMSVNMIREDARTVSISHISVSDEIKFGYFDNLNQSTRVQTIKRINH
ncbi:MAG: hypothetical protein COB38_05480 [Gammaproteobacteria bacterium]|nr:MAG: hypothetical protein COB38_05480 [Gammaproteobacteria bacterium]